MYFLKGKQNGGIHEDFAQEFSYVSLGALPIMSTLSIISPPKRHSTYYFSLICDKLN